MQESFPGPPHSGGNNSSALMLSNKEFTFLVLKNCSSFTSIMKTKHGSFPTPPDTHITKLCLNCLAQTESKHWTLNPICVTTVWRYQHRWGEPSTAPKVLRLEHPISHPASPKQLPSASPGSCCSCNTMLIWDRLTQTSSSCFVEINILSVNKETFNSVLF